MSVNYEEKASRGLEELGLKVAASQLDQASQRAAAEGWSYSHFLGYLLASETEARHRRGVELNLQFAKLPVRKRLGDFDYSAQPGVDRRLIEEMATGRFLAEGRNILFLGPPRSWEDAPGNRTSSDDSGDGTSSLLHLSHRDGSEVDEGDE